MATQRRREHPVRRRRRSKQYKIGTGSGSRFFIMLAVVAAVIFSVAIFFKVHTVEVRGNAVYDSQTVAAASGLEAGDNLLAINKAQVAGKIKAALPYVEQVRIARVMPDTVVLEVRESDAVFSVKSDDGQNWLMSFSGKVLEQVTNEAAEAHPTITGFALKAPEPGAVAKSENSENLTAALTLLNELGGTGLANKVSKLDASKPYHLVMWYADQYEILLGGTDQMDYKIQYLLAVLDELTQYQTGTIDLTFQEEKVARFIPW